MSHSSPKTEPNQPEVNLEAAIRLARHGKKQEARLMLRQVVAWQPVNQAAWVWLSALAEDKAEAEAALTQARRINPAHPSLPRAEQWTAQRFSAQPPTRITKVVSNTPALPTSLADRADLFNTVGLGLVIGAIVVSLLVLLMGLGIQLNVVAQTASPTPSAAAPDRLPAQLAAVWAEKNWPQAIAILEPLYQTTPDSSLIQTRLTTAYLEQGLTLRRKGFIEEAQPFFEKALAVTPDQPQAKQEQQWTAQYLAGVHHYQSGQWTEAITMLKPLWVGQSGYPHLTDLLYSAYYNHGLALQATHTLTAAQTAFETALTLRPDLPEPRRQLAQLAFSLAPETPLETPLIAPTAKNQLIVVGIAEQEMQVFDRNQLVFDFVVSTGEPGRDTAIGDFEILDKIEVAYASTWNLDMPYWMGIYWAGPLQNGIHSLPIVKHTGYKLWDGYLGQRVSYGCVILGDDDAATLYNWAEVGAKVKIVPSLTGWLAENNLPAP